MKTIRSKLFFIFVLFMAAFAVGVLLLNALFLERYYIYTSRALFISSQERIAGIYSKEPQRLMEVLKEIDRVDSINCSIYDRNMRLSISSYPAKPGARPEKGGPDMSKQNDGKLPRELEQLWREHPDDYARSYVYGIVESPDYHVREIAFICRLPDDSILVMKKPLKGITESSVIANRFVALTSLFIMIIGGIFIYLFSRRMTRPIVTMSHVAEEIANLNFKRQVPAASRDEIGDLGRSINRISERLSASIEELREDVERRKQLVRNLSHEMKTPIGVIKGYAEGLKFGIADDPAKAADYCSVIAAECDRMDGMVRELLNLSLLESGTFEANLSILDLAMLLSNLAEKFRPMLLARGISLEMHCPPGLRAMADPELLERAVSNFLVNAMDYVNEAGYIELSAVRQADEVRIAVYNTGNPIPESELAKIWDVFYKLDKARTRKRDSYGLGLSIVKTIADILGGNCGVVNESGGVLFYLDLKALN